MTCVIGVHFGQLVDYCYNIGMHLITFLKHSHAKVSVSNLERRLS
jgi:hypothetical protein